ncbi:MAG: M23 family metallopeptidase [Woeseiaceae bacterium]
MRCLARALLVALALAAPTSGLEAACDCDWLCVARDGEDDTLGLQVRNRSSVPLTFTLRFNVRDFAVEGPAELTETLAAGERLELPSLRRRGARSVTASPFRCDWTIGNKDAAHDDEHVYLLPYAAGRSFRVLQGFGSRFSHTGTEQFTVDFKMAEGTPVHAARGGVVARIEESHSRGCWNGGCGRYANFVVILHDDQTTGEYYHLQRDGVLVEPGDRVEAGQPIALSGNTGNSALPHLHFGVYRAIEWGREQSVPFRFLSADGVIDNPRRGGLYLAVEPGIPERRASLGKPAASPY